MFSRDVAASIDAPRFRFDKAWGAPRATLKLESRFDPDIVAGLERAGHDIEMAGLPYGDSFGHAGMLVRHRDGRVEATHDPRSDGGAEGI